MQKNAKTGGKTGQRDPDVAVKRQEVGLNYQIK